MISGSSGGIVSCHAVFTSSLDIHTSTKQVMLFQFEMGQRLHYLPATRALAGGEYTSLSVTNGGSESVMPLCEETTARWEAQGEIKSKQLHQAAATKDRTVVIMTLCALEI